MTLHLKPARTSGKLAELQQPDELSIGEAAKEFGVHWAPLNAALKALVPNSGRTIEGITRAGLRKKTVYPKAVIESVIDSKLAAEALAHWTDPEADQDTSGQTATLETVPVNEPPPAETNGHAAARQDQGGGTAAGESRDSEQKPKKRRGPKTKRALVGSHFLKQRQVKVLIFVSERTEPPLEKHIADFCDQKRIGGTLRAELNELFEIGFLLRGDTGWKSPGIRITDSAVEALAALN